MKSLAVGQNVCRVWRMSQLLHDKDYLSLPERVGLGGPYKWFIGIYTSLHFRCRHVMEQEIIISSLKPLVSLSLSCKRQCSPKSFDIIFLFLIF